MTMVINSTGVKAKSTYVCLFVRFLILSIFIQYHIDGILAQRNVGQPCIRIDGRQGVCLEISQCPSAVYSGNTQATCGYWRNNAIVCCRKKAAVYNPENNLPSDQDYPIEDINDFNRNQDSDTSYEQSDRRQSGQPWWIQDNRPFGETTEYSRPIPTRRPTTSTTTRSTTRRPFVNRPSNRPNDGSIWGFDNGDRPTTNRPVTNKPFATRPINNRPNNPSNNRPATSAPFRPPTRPSQGKSISEQKCIEYSRSVSTSVGALPLLPNAEPVIIEIPKCDYNSVPLIVGGTQAVPGEFPHMAVIGYRSNQKIDWDCGGSLISEFFVMTAAHCAASAKGPPHVVRLGELDLVRDNDGADPKNYRVLNVVRHPDYKAPARYNDIALLQLVDKVTFNKFIRPACLYNKNTFDVDKAVATGWGKIDFAESRSDILLKVSINLIDSKLCNERYETDKNSDRLREGIVPTMLCAGDLKGGKDTCQGDSGGPLQITSRNNQCIFHIVGITSFGKFCAAENTPGVYTRVSSYIPWIESVVWP